MYSVVLLAGLAAGSDNPPAAVVVQAVPVVGCTGCTGYAGCTGCTGYYAGCTGYVSGCSGTCHGGLLSRIHARCQSHRAARYSSCYGSCYGGCYGSCYGSSCFGSCYGGSCYGSVAMPAYGSCFSNGYSYGNYYYSSQAVYGTYAAPVVTVPVENKFVTPGMKSDTTEPKKSSDAIPEPMKNGGSEGANLKFNLPAGAKLYVDGRLANGDGSERTFFTPKLDAGQKYFYEVKAEMMIAGEMVTEEKRVIVYAGAELRESFPKLIAAAEKASTLANK